MCPKVSQWGNVERPFCSLPDFECMQTGSCGSQTKVWVLGLHRFYNFIRSIPVIHQFALNNLDEILWILGSKLNVGLLRFPFDFACLS